MQKLNKPITKPSCSHFSSGPCAKRPGWSVACLDVASLGRSHRSKVGKSKLRELISRSRSILGVPETHHVGLVPASDTGAFELAMWSLLGERGIDLLAWESFGRDWVSDVTNHLRLNDLRIFDADYGELPDLTLVNFSRDVVFTWNGTTSGVCVPNGDWIASDREGLTICDATSAAFAMSLPWEKLDVVTYSWQKVMGGEGAHGMLILSPNAIKRLETYSPPWPLPKIFRLTKNGKLINGIFEGATINTPSMLAVEDALDGLKWAEEIGGLKALIARTSANMSAITNWIDVTNNFSFLAKNPTFRSPTSVCLEIISPWFCGLRDVKRGEIVKDLVDLLETEGVALDIGAYRDAPLGLRVWAGATIETHDLEALFPWLEWALVEVGAAHAAF